VKSRLISTGLADRIAITGVKLSGDVVLAIPIDGVDLQKVLEADSDFSKDMFSSGWGHKGCYVSFRQKISPSLQVSFFHDSQNKVILQLDIDRFAPLWNHPINIFRHVFQEVGSHWIKKNLFGKNARTNQRKIAKAIAKENNLVLAAKD
jgi:hypothetical protein